jgi:hypothetical protein
MLERISSAIQGGSLLIAGRVMRSMRLRSRYLRLFQRILALRLYLGGMQERIAGLMQAGADDW